MLFFSLLNLSVPRLAFAGKYLTSLIYRKITAGTSHNSYLLAALSVKFSRNSWTDFRIVSAVVCTTPSLYCFVQSCSFDRFVPYRRALHFD